MPLARRALSVADDDGANKTYCNDTFSDQIMMPHFFDEACLQRKNSSRTFHGTDVYGKRGACPIAFIDEQVGLVLAALRIEEQCVNLASYVAVIGLMQAGGIPPPQFDGGADLKDKIVNNIVWGLYMLVFLGQMAVTIFAELLSGFNMLAVRGAYPECMLPAEKPLGWVPLKMFDVAALFSPEVIMRHLLACTYGAGIAEGFRLLGACQARSARARARARRRRGGGEARARGGGEKRRARAQREETRPLRSPLGARSRPRLDSRRLYRASRPRPKANGSCTLTRCARSRTRPARTVPTICPGSSVSSTAWSPAWSSASWSE